MGNVNIEKTKSPEKSSRLFAVRTGLEPATPCVTGMYSNQLNYRTNLIINFPFEKRCKGNT